MPSSSANISSDLQLYLLTHCFLAVRLHNIMIPTYSFTFQKKRSFKLARSTKEIYMNTQNSPPVPQYQAFLAFFYFAA